MFYTVYLSGLWA